MKLIVCGGRDYTDRVAVFRALDEIHALTPISFIVHGAAKGADRLAAEWAEAHGIGVEGIAADWKRYRGGAGPKRNQDMADGGADLCVAFPGGKGTADMCRRAESAGIKVVRPSE